MGELRRLEARLTEEQMDMLDGFARDTGLTKTDVIRTLITHASVADKLEITGETVIVLDRVSASKIAYQLRKVGINLNQATAALNTMSDGFIPSPLPVDGRPLTEAVGSGSAGGVAPGAGVPSSG